MRYRPIIRRTAPKRYFAIFDPFWIRFENCVLISGRKRAIPKNGMIAPKVKKKKERIFIDMG